MNIKKVLEQCIYADLTDFDENTNTYHIKKYSKKVYKIQSCYLVKISDYIVKNPNSVVATNWNNGKAPQVNYMKIFVSKILGQNIYIDGLGFDFETKQDTNYMWSGWLPISDLEQITAL